MVKRLVYLLAVMMLAATVTAQEERARTLVAGDIVEARITNEEFELFYSFKGEEGDLIVFELRVTEDRSQLNSPELVLFNSDNEVIQDTYANIGGYQRAITAVTLPYTGLYSLLVTREDGRAGEDEGDFRLRVIEPTILVPNETLNDAALNDEIINYYVVLEDAPFSVYYEFSNGELDPYIEGYRVEDGELENIASLDGRELISGSIGMDGGLADVHIVTVGDSPFATYFDNRVERVDYRLRLTVQE